MAKEFVKNGFGQGKSMGLGDYTRAQIWGWDMYNQENKRFCICLKGGKLVCERRAESGELNLRHELRGKMHL
jgi:hypothetical protein